MLDNSFPACCCCFVVICLFFKVEISLRTLIPLVRPGSAHSGSASWGRYNRVFPDELRVSSFPDRFPHSAWTAAYSVYSDFDGSRVYACLGVTCHLRFWSNDRGLLRATAITRGWNGHGIRVSTQSRLAKKILSLRRVQLWTLGNRYNIAYRSVHLHKEYRQGDVSVSKSKRRIALCYSSF